MLKQKFYKSTLIFVVVFLPTLTSFATKVDVKDKVKNLCPGYSAIINEAGFWALKSKKQGVITNFIYNKIENYNNSNELFITEISGLFGLLDNNGNTIKKNIFKTLNYKEKKKYSKCEVRDENMQVILTFFADSVQDIDNTAYLIWRNGNSYLNNKINDKPVTNSLEDNLMPLGKVQEIFTFKSLKVIKKNNFYRIYNLNYKKINGFKYHQVKKFSSFLLAKYINNGVIKAHIIDKFGDYIYQKHNISNVYKDYVESMIVNVFDNVRLYNKISGKLLPQIFQKIKYLNNNRYFYILKSESGIIDLNGNNILSENFSNVEKINADLFLFKIDDYNGFIINDKISYKTKNQLVYKNGFIWEKIDAQNVVIRNDKGQKLYPHPVSQAKVLNQFKLRTYIKFKYLGYQVLIDEYGRIIVPHTEKYDSIGDIPSVFFQFCKDKSCGLINTDGIMIITNRYEAVNTISEGRIGYKLLNKWGFLDSTEALITQPKFEKITPFRNKFAAVKRNGLWGLLDITGKWVLNPKYNMIKWNNQSGWIIQHNNHQGFIDNHGHELIKPNAYHLCEQLNESFINAKMGDLCILFNINTKGYEKETWKSIKPMNYNNTWLFIK